MERKTSQYVRTAPPKDYSARPGKAPFKLTRDWAPHTPQTPPPDDVYREGHERTFGHGQTKAEFCPDCDLRLTWCECVKAP